MALRDCISCCDNSSKYFICNFCKETIICNDCICLYISLCLKEDKIPKCYECNNNILPSKISDKLLKDKLIDCYINSIKKLTFLDVFSNKIKNKRIFQELIQKRKDFFIENLPKSIKLTIDILFKDKMKKIEKISLKYEDADIGPRCYNEFCNGNVVNNKCYKCEINFCSICHKEKKNGHICDDDDLKSIELLKGYAKCPKCLTPCEKISGCNNITCPITSCKTMFDYVTGKVSEAGNHDTLKIELRDNRKLSINSKVSFGVKKELIKFEKLEPFYNAEVIVTFAEENNKKSLERELDFYSNYVIKINRYNKILFKLNELLDKNLLTEDDVIKYSKNL
jgi:hypothetical protein